MAKHIALVDGLWNGHHATYLMKVTAILLEQGHQVSVYCPQPLQLFEALHKPPKLNAYCYKDTKSFDFKLIPGRVKHLLWAIGRWYAIKKAIHATAKPDLIFFAWLDNYLDGNISARLIDHWLPIPWVGLYFHPRHLRVQNRPKRFYDGYLKKPETLVMRSHFSIGLAVLDEGVIPELKARMPSKTISWFPDFIDDSYSIGNDVLARQIKSRAKGKKIIGMIGSLEKRKGLLTLIDTAAHSMDEDWFFIFIGNLATSSFSDIELAKIRSIAAEGRTNCFFHFERIDTEEEFNGLIIVCDVIYAVYENFLHSSNLLTKAAAYKKPVLVSADGYMAELAKNYRLGLVVTDRSITSIKDFIRKIIGQYEVDDNGRTKYLEQRSLERVKQVILEMTST